MTDETDDVTGRAKGGVARAMALSPQERKEIAEKAAKARWATADAPKAEYIGTLHIGDLEIPCAVLPDGRRLLSQRGIMAALGRRLGGADYRRQLDQEDGGGKIPVYLGATSIKPFISNELMLAVSVPIPYRHGQGGGVAQGVDASQLPQICDVWLKAREAGALTKSQLVTAAHAEILVRGLAHVGIISLVDEATGYQKDRAKDALAQILEAFVAKEIQPWVKTFPADYYEQLFRLRGLPYPPENAKYRPQYFGVLTNDIVYKRLAPGILDELKRQNEKDEKKGKLHQRLTTSTGHPKLREHLASSVTIMKLSRDYPDFIEKMNMIHPRYGDTIPLGLTDEDKG